MEQKPVWRPINPGRKKKYGEETVVIRVPKSLAKKCEEWVYEQIKDRNVKKD